MAAECGVQIPGQVADRGLGRRRQRPHDRSGSAGYPSCRVIGGAKVTGRQDRPR